MNRHFNLLGGGRPNERQRNEPLKRPLLLCFNSALMIGWEMALRDPVAFENGKSAASRQFLRTHRVSHSYTTLSRKRWEVGEEKPASFVFVVRVAAWGGLGHSVKCQAFN